MAFDGITIAAMVKELHLNLDGGRFNKIAQPEADELLITGKAANAVRPYCVNDIHFDEPVDSDKDGNQLCLIDIIADGEDVADKIELSIRSEQLYRYIESSLDERERQIVTLRYGLFGQPQLPQREVAKRLGISRSYVSRIEKKALKLLKDRFDKQ